MKRTLFILSLMSLSLTAPQVSANTTEALKEQAIEAYDKAKQKTKEGVKFLDDATQPLQEKSKKVWNSLKQKWETYKDKDQTPEQSLKETGVL